MPINTQNFKTQTIFQPRQSPSVPGFWGIAIDVGYSGVKSFSPNMIASFPSYARKITKEQQPKFGKAERTNILYMNEDGELWVVGSSAQEFITVDDADSSTSGLYIRDRFASPMFKVIARVGLALGMTKNQYGDPSDKTLHVQTGLPPAYMKTNSEDLIDALSGHHEFRIKLGEDPWQTFSFDLPETNISIMPQPMGTLISIATDRNGGQLTQAKQYFTSNLLIFDPGFGTLDTFDIKNRYLNSHKTYDDLGMRRVLQETCDTISERYRNEIPVPAMQECLGRGTFKYTNKKEKKSSFVEFGDILEECNKKVCLEALQAVDEVYNGLFNHDYLVITGGTGAAWSNYIREYYSGLETLTIISGDVNDSILPIFSNVRGYYMNELNTLKRVVANKK